MCQQQLLGLQQELKRREDLLKGVPLMLADFMERNQLPEPAVWPTALELAEDMWEIGGK